MWFREHKILELPELIKINNITSVHEGFETPKAFKDYFEQVQYNHNLRCIPLGSVSTPNNIEKTIKYQCALILELNFETICDKNTPTD